MSEPAATMIPRVGDKTKPDDFDEGSVKPADWADVEARLRKGPGPWWLSATIDDASHVRPVFAAWTGESFVVASSPGARKTRALRNEARCSLAVDLSGLHLVVEGRASRLVGEADLKRASAAFEQVYGWPTEPTGDLLDSSYAAPSSGGPPFEAYEIVPVKAFGFPTDDQFEPTRWRWDS